MKLLIVEDEFIIRKGIVTSIEWEKLGIHQVAEAKNGVEALNILPQIQPDIVITDIRMPIMDGLKLTEEIRKNDSSIQIVILSGYQEFAYAKQAIHFDVFEYLIKPVGREELTRVIQKVIAKIKRESTLKNEWTKLTTIYHENVDLISNRWLNNVCNGNTELTQQELEYGKQIGINFSGPLYQVLIFEIDDYQKLQASKKEIGSIHNFLSVEIEHVFPSSWNAIVWRFNSNRMGIILNLHEQQIPVVLEKIYQLQNVVKKEGNFTVTIGKSEAFFSLSQLSESVQQANKALNQKQFFGKNTIYSVQEIADEEDHLHISKAEEETLLQCVRKLQVKEIHTIVQDLFLRCKKNRVKIKLMKNWCLKILFLIIEDRYLSHASNSKDHLLAQIETVDNIDDLKQFFFDEISSILKTIEANKQKSTSNTITRAISYMENHYQDKITLEMMAKYTYVSPAYFSKLFKEETGYTFIDWLNTIRVNEAKRLFHSNPQLPIYKVAEIVGIHNYKYFVTLFKKQTGLTPSEFKNMASS